MIIIIISHLFLSLVVSSNTDDQDKAPTSSTLSVTVTLPGSLFLITINSIKHRYSLCGLNKNPFFKIWNNLLCNNFGIWKESYFLFMRCVFPNSSHFICPNTFKCFLTSWPVVKSNFIFFGIHSLSAYYRC